MSLFSGAAPENSDKKGNPDARRRIGTVGGVAAVAS